MIVVVSSCDAATAIVTRASAVALRRGEEHRRLEEVGVAQCRVLSSRPAARASRRKPSVPSTTRSASSTIAAGASSDATPTQTARSSVALAGSCAQPPEGVQVGGVVAAVRARSRARCPRAAAATAVPLSTAAVGRISSTLRPQCGCQPGVLRGAARRAPAPRGPRPRRGRRASGRTRSRPCPRASRRAAASSA